jgi:ubiquinone biosynthesis protein COQ4
LVQRLRWTAQHALAAIRDPTRADSVAAIGELTGVEALRQLLSVMRQHPVGQVILKDQPMVTQATVDLAKQAATLSVQNTTSDQDISFGRAYLDFLEKHGFDPEERDPICYLTSQKGSINESGSPNIDDDDDKLLAYIMLRYRQCHDYWHVLTGLPPTVAGELGLKWLELFQTRLPLAALAVTAGSLSLGSNQSDSMWPSALARDLHLVHGVYCPWAVEMGYHRMPFGSLLCVYYEKEFHTPLSHLRIRMILEPVAQQP